MPATTAGRSWTPMTVAVALALLAVAILAVAIATAGRGGTDAAPDGPDRDAPDSGTETPDGGDEAAGTDGANDDGAADAERGTLVIHHVGDVNLDPSQLSTTSVASLTVEPGGGTEACLLPFRIDADGVPRPTGDEPDCG